MFDFLNNCWDVFKERVDNWFTQVNNWFNTLLTQLSKWLNRLAKVSVACCGINAVGGYLVVAPEPSGLSTIIGLLVILIIVMMSQVSGAF